MIFSSYICYICHCPKQKQAKNTISSLQLILLMKQKCWHYKKAKHFKNRLFLTVHGFSQCHKTIQIIWTDWKAEKPYCVYCKLGKVIPLANYFEQFDNHIELGTRIILNQASLSVLHTKQISFFKSSTVKKWAFWEIYIIVWQFWHMNQTFCIALFGETSHQLWSRFAK